MVKDSWYLRIQVQEKARASFQAYCDEEGLNYGDKVGRLIETFVHKTVDVRKGKKND